jgi:lipopolysaccharide transport system permease protein
VIAALGEMLGHRELLLTLIERQLRLRAKRSLFGIAWPIISPVFLVALYIFVFHGVFQVPVQRYPAFLIAGLLPWTFLAQSLGQAITSLANEPELIRRAPFPYALLPIASVLSMATFFLATLALFLIYLAVTGGLFLNLLPLLALPVVALLLFVAAVAMILALIDVYSRDLRHVLANLLTVWFFLVPIVYRPDMVDAKLQLLRSIDPANMVVGQFRDILYFGHISNAGHLALMLAVCTAFFIVTVTGFRRFSVNLAAAV